jgi:antitoxin component HigA of HigAB toxin-antitoxin module
MVARDCRPRHPLDHTVRADRRPCHPDPSASPRPPGAAVGAELVCLAVAQVLLGARSEHHWLRMCRIRRLRLLRLSFPLVLGAEATLADHHGRATAAANKSKSMIKRTYKVSTRRWSGGWELHVAGEGVTQVRTLDKADRQVRDYLETLHDADFSDAVVTVVPELGGLEVEVAAARKEAEEAAAAQVAAAEHVRKVVKALRRSGLSTTDTAAVLGVSRGRISQLV